MLIKQGKAVRIREGNREIPEQYSPTKGCEKQHEHDGYLGPFHFLAISNKDVPGWLGIRGDVEGCCSGAFFTHIRAVGKPGIPPHG